MRFLVRGPARLRGAAHVPSDKSIVHRAFLLGALAEGRSRIGVRDLGGDNRSTLGAIRALGVDVTEAPDAVGIAGVGLDGLSAPTGTIDAGNSGTTMRLLLGVLAGRRFGATVDGDASLRRRPMGRVVSPLRRMRARIAGRDEGGDVRAPIVSEGLRSGERLHGIEHRTDVPSAQVKSAILLAGLWAEGQTLVEEPVLSRDHTERMLAAQGVPIATLGSAVGVDPSGWDGRMPPFEMDAPGDLSSAAFLLAAAVATGSGPVVVRHVGINPTRTGMLDVLRDMGATFRVVPKGDAGGEPVGEILVEGGVLAGARVGGELFVRLVDEVPALVAVAATVDRETVIRDAAELRVKESDRIAALGAMLRAFGVACEELEDGIVLHGGKRHAAEVDSHGDHRIAMAAAVLGLATEGETVIEDVACVQTSFPGFAETLRALGADLEVAS